MSNQEILFAEQKIAAYDPFRAQLAELKEGNAKAVFDYEDPKGNKEARSHIFKLRKTKSAIDKVRKEQKDASLQYGRRVDAQAKEITVEIEEMIEVHETPIKEIEQHEKDRIANHQKKMDHLESYLSESFDGCSSDLLKSTMEELKNFEPDESFEEFTAPAIKIWKDTKERLQAALDARIKYEAEQAELEKLRAEQAVREKKEREEKIAREAAENARKEAEEIAAKKEAEHQAALKAAKEEKIQLEQKAKRNEEAAKAQAAAAEQAKIEAEKQAEERAKQAAREAEDAIKAAAQKVIDDEKKREADKKHFAKINNESADCFFAEGFSEADAKKIVALIAQKKIKNIHISY